MKSLYTVSWLNRLLLLSGSILLSCLFVTAALAQSVGVTVGSADGAQNTAVQIPVSLSNVPPPTDPQGIVGIEITLTYNPAVVRAPMHIDNGPVTDSAALTALTTEWSLEQNALLSNPADLNSQTGTLNIALAHQMPLTGDGAILTLTWNLVGAPDACSDITIAEIHLFPTTGEDDELPVVQPIPPGEICVVIPSDVTLTLSAPNGGEQITAGSTFTIGWNTTGSGIDHIHLQYSTDSGATYPNDIVLSTPNDGSHDWTTPSDLNSTTVRVKAIAEDASKNPLAMDASNADFTIKPVVNPVISRVQASNYQNSEITITWCTDIASSTQVNYGTTPTLGQMATGANNVTLHQVNVTGLTAETRYYFNVQSGNTIDDNQGNLYQFKTTKIGGINPFHTVFGFVYKDEAKTQPAVRGLVFLTVTNGTGTSYPISTLTGNSGDWALDLTSLKNPTTNDNFSYAAGDAIHVDVNCCNDGTARADATVSTGGVTQIPDLICKKTVVRTLNLKAGLNMIGFPVQFPFRIPGSDPKNYTSKSLLPLIPHAVKIYNLRPGGG
ncbi:hypothetical protein HYR99_05160, partial [Candidatus Poribacteria bacterium]|nr:hypothetical protein [Candidatus Poribacteria bacterium]